jgi:hypothetical protein
MVVISCPYRTTPTFHDKNEYVDFAGEFLSQKAGAKSVLRDCFL